MRLDASRREAIDADERRRGVTPPSGDAMRLTRPSVLDNPRDRAADLRDAIATTNQGARGYDRVVIRDRWTRPVGWTDRSASAAEPYARIRPKFAARQARYFARLSREAAGHLDRRHRREITRSTPVADASIAPR